MKTILHALVWALGLIFSCAAWSAQSLSGDLTGTFTSSATDGSGAYSGGIEGRWTAAATFGDDGITVESAAGSGTFGGVGLAGAWSVARYDAATKTIHVTWKGPGERGPLSTSGSADGSVTLIIDTAKGIATGVFEGQVHTPHGTKTIRGQWTVQFRGLANSTVSGKVAGSFAGSASYVGSVAGTVTGDWTARIQADGSVSGTASGSYDGGNVAIPGYGSICICGTWLANVVSGSNGEYQLQGAWTHPVVSGSLDGSGGGPLVWYLNLGTTPFQASGNFDGQVSFRVSVPVIGTMNIPVTVGGTWNATLPLNP